MTSHKADIELNSECGLCQVAISGDLSKIHCDPCFWLPKTVELTKEVL